jgi:hypothetical protein
LKVAWALPSTTITAGYTYSFKYYDDKPANREDHDDQTHNFQLGLDHRFSDSWSLSLSDSFVIGQEPDFLRTGNSYTTFQPIEGDNIRNFGRVMLKGQFNPTFGMQVGYDNAFYDYDQEGASLIGGQYFQSTSGALDRLEHGIPVEGIWVIKPETRGILGYRYRMIDYTGDEPIGGTVANPVMSDDRNSQSHTAYLGVDHNFRPDLTGSLRGGATFSDYDSGNSDNEVSPYVQASLRYTYAEESFGEVGFTYDRTATDVVGFDAATDGFVTDAETAAFYVSVTHRILPKLYGSLIGQFQNSTYEGGMFDSQDENFWIAGVNLEYRINQYFSAHVGYNYDFLDSDYREYDRNRVYIGLTARY